MQANRNEVEVCGFNINKTDFRWYLIALKRIFDEFGFLDFSTRKIALRLRQAYCLKKVLIFF